MKDDAGGVATEEFVGLKPKIYSINGNSKHKKTKGANKNFVLTKNHN